MSQYATSAEFDAMGGLPARVTAQLTSAQKDAALQQASGVADGYLRSNYALPMVSPPMDLKFAVARIAADILLGTLGYNPESGADINVKTGYKDAVAWLRDVSKGAVLLGADSDATPGLEEGGPVVISDGPRGWLDTRRMR